MTERQWVLLLRLLPGVGDQTARQTLTRMQVNRIAREQLFQLDDSTLKLEYGFSAQTLTTVRKELDKWLREAERLDDHLTRCGARWITFQDAAYPAALESLPEPPAVLFGYGKWDLLNQTTFAVLGSHDISPLGLTALETVVKTFIESGWTLIASSTQPAYQQAMLTALRYNSPHALILDQGLLHVFGEDMRQEPVPAARVWRMEFDPMQDFALSAFRPRDHYLNPYGQKRDRIVAVLASALIVVEARPQGRMESLCKNALESGKKVYVCAHDLANQPGNQRLIEAGGTPIGEP